MIPTNSFKSQFFPLFLNNDSQVLLGSKHMFVQQLTISLLSEVSVEWRIMERFNTCHFILVLFVPPFVPLSHVHANIEKQKQKKPEWLCICYLVFWDYIEFKRRADRKKIQKIQRDENMVFQENRQKMQTYLNAFWTKRWPQVNTF